MACLYAPQSGGYMNELFTTQKYLMLFLLKLCWVYFEGTDIIHETPYKSISYIPKSELSPRESILDKEISLNDVSEVKTYYCIIYVMLFQQDNSF